ncbi:MAG: Arm DNA-binding domain-containing protein, partial [Stellaceae bacterium]
MMGTLMGRNRARRTMARKAKGLSALRVKNEKRPGLYADGGGLYLQIAPSGSKTWIFRFQRGGKRRDMGLGPIDLF